MAGLQLLLCKSKKRLSHSGDIAKQDSFESPSHSSLTRCLNSPADLLRLTRVICWVRRWLSLDFFPSCVRYFPWSCSCPARTLSSMEKESSENLLCRDGSWSTEAPKPSCCCHLSDAEHSEGFYSHGGCLGLGEGSEQPLNRNL